MKKLVLAMVALLAIFTFIREYSGSRQAGPGDIERAQAAPALVDPLARADL